MCMKGGRAGKFRYFPELNALNRGLMSDEFIGYISVPLSQFGMFE